MGKTTYTVFRSDLMSGTDVGSHLASVRYCVQEGGEYVPAEIENGSVVELVELEENNREVWIGVDVRADSKIGDVAVIGTAEILYDERKKNLNQFTNEAGTIARGYRLHSGDIFSITKDGFANADATIEVGDSVEFTDGHKLSVAKDAANPIGRIIGIENTVRYTYFVIKIN